MEKQENKETAIVKIDPKEYGLEEKKAKEIQVAFAPITVEADALIDGYESIITSELSADLSKKARKIWFISKS